MGRVCYSAKWHDPFGRVALRHKHFILSSLRRFNGARLPDCQIANGPFGKRRFSKRERRCPNTGMAAPTRCALTAQKPTRHGYYGPGHGKCALMEIRHVIPLRRLKPEAVSPVAPEDPGEGSGSTGSRPEEGYGRLRSDGVRPTPLVPVLGQVAVYAVPVARQHTPVVGAYQPEVVNLTRKK